MSDTPAPTISLSAVHQPLMAGKRGLIMGVANDHSIAWGIAEPEWCNYEGVFR